MRSEVRGVQFDEALEALEPRDGHVDDLALAERHAADRELRRVGAHLDRPRLLPGPEALEMERRPLRADEVRDASRRTRESRDAADLHLAPDAIARGGLRQHVPVRQVRRRLNRRDGPRPFAKAGGSRSLGAIRCDGVTRRRSAPRSCSTRRDSRSHMIACQPARTSQEEARVALATRARRPLAISRSRRLRAPRA
jgi:hypothetical protein